MPLPSGLKFTDRLAKDSSGVFFRCHRGGHPNLWKRFTHEIDAKGFRAAHDTAHHNPTFRNVGFTPERNEKVSVILAEWLAHVERMEVEGVRSPQTTRHYKLICSHLEDACKECRIRTARDVTPQKVSELVGWFRKKTDTEGALTVKALSALKTMLAWKGLPRDWKIPHDEIRAQKRTKKDLDSETIRRVIGAMPEGSIEQAAAYLKARTGARDVEIYRARKEDFDLELGVFAPNISKRIGKVRRHAYALTDDAMRKVRPFVERAKGGGFVFEEDGRPMTTERMRPKIRAAAKKAGLVTTRKNSRQNKAGKREYEYEAGAVESIAQIRAEIVTLVYEEKGIAAAAQHVGHRSETTSERWYLKNRLTTDRLEEKRRTAEIIARAIPLKGAQKGARRSPRNAANSKTSRPRKAAQRHEDSAS